MVAECVEGAKRVWRCDGLGEVVVRSADGSRLAWVTRGGDGESGLGSYLVLKVFEGGARDNGGGSSAFSYEAVRRGSVADTRRAIPPQFLLHRGGMLYFPLRLYNFDGSFSTFYRGSGTAIVSLVESRLNVFFLLVIHPRFVPTNEQLADIFTKVLRKQQYYFLICKLGIQDLHAPT